MTAIHKHMLLLGTALLAASVLALFSFSSRMAEDACLDRGGAWRSGACVYGYQAR